LGVLDALQDVRHAIALLQGCVGGDAFVWVQECVARGVCTVCVSQLFPPSPQPSPPLGRLTMLCSHPHPGPSRQPHSFPSFAHRAWAGTSSRHPATVQAFLEDLACAARPLAAAELAAAAAGISGREGPRRAWDVLHAL